MTEPRTKCARCKRPPVEGYASCEYHMEYDRNRLLSFTVGFSDITPFVVAVLQGDFPIADRQIQQAIIIASASNNLLKTAYVFALGSRRTARMVAPGLIGLALLSLLYVALGQ